ncbi:MAG: hypothetical protein IJW45_04555 [Oscillospiraceae bacterium]|nr:hypothetical protein [Oscillospiraceae bacterium]
MLLRRCYWTSSAHETRSWQISPANWTRSPAQSQSRHLIFQIRRLLFSSPRSRPIYLELALDASVLTVTKTGCQSQSLPWPKDTDYPHREEALCCHYRIDQDPEQIRFTLARTPGDLPDLLSSLQRLEVTALVGLHQELWDALA